MNPYKHMKEEYPEDHSKLTLKEHREKERHYDKKLAKHFIGEDEDIEI